MFLDKLPTWGVLIANLVLVLVALHAGVRLGTAPMLRRGGKLEVSGAMVAAAMALLSFMLAFTFNGAAGRHDARKALVVEEANAIETTWLRAGFLADPQRTRIRGLLRDYVDLRLKAATGDIAIADGLRQAGALRDQMWSVALQAGQQRDESVMTGLFVESLNEVLDLNVKRITIGLRARVPPLVWLSLHVLLVAGMMMIGMQLGLSGTRHYGAEAGLAVSFSLVMFLIVDLDRPQEGLINVSQQALVDLQERLAAR